MIRTVKSTGMQVELTGVHRADVDKDGNTFYWVQVHKVGAEKGQGLFSVKESDLK